MSIATKRRWWIEGAMAGLVMAAFVPVGAAPLSDPQRLLARGSFNEAERAARDLLSVIDEEGPAETIEAAETIDVLVEALLRQRKSGEPDLRDLAERAVALRGDLLGASHPSLVLALTRLGDAHAALAHFDEAETALERARELAGESLDPDDPATGRFLSTLAALRHGQGRYSEAIDLFEQALSLQHHSLYTLCRYGSLLNDIGQFAPAVEVFERAIEPAETTFGSDHPEVAWVLLGYGAALRESDLQRSTELLERGTRIAERFGSAQPVLLGTSRIRWAWSVMYRGEYDAAGAGFREGLALLEEVYGPDHPDLLETRFDYARFVVRTGDHAEALRLLRQVVASREKVLGMRHPDVGRTLVPVGWLLSEGGDHAAAAETFRRTVEIATPVADAAPRQMLNALAGYGDLLRWRGDYAESRAVFERALAFAGQDLPGVSEFWLAASQLNLAQLLNQIGEHDEAKALLELALPGLRTQGVALELEGLFVYAKILHNQGSRLEARRLYEEVLDRHLDLVGEENYDVAVVMLALAGLLRESGEPIEAQRLYQRAGEILRIQFRLDAPAIGEAWLGSAESMLDLGRNAQALEAALRAEEIGRESLRLTTRGLPERQALHYASSRVRGLDVALSALERSGAKQAEPIVQAWDAVVRSRAVVLDEMAQRHRLLGEVDDPSIAALADRLSVARRRLANLTVAGAAGTDPADHRRAFDRTRREKEQIELALALKSAEFRRQRARESVGLAEVAAALPSGDALLAYASYEGHPPSSNSERERRYVAFVLGPSADESVTVPLGSAEALDRSIRAWLELASSDPGGALPRAREAESEYRVAGDRLRRQLWDPVAPHVEGAGHLFVIPDAAIHLVSLATLPTGSSKYLVETGPVLHYLSAERDLLRKKRPPSGTRRLLALGDPDFEARPGTVPTPAPRLARLEGNSTARSGSKAVYRGPAPACGDFSAMSFAPLPGSLGEVDAISALWEHAGKTAPRTTEGTKLTGTSAHEGLFKQMAPQHDVLHLATHGFVLDDKCVANPLLLSGLALAGANNRTAAGAHQEDGVLTAEEIASLDLSGVQWVVLSACRTGVGELVNGEGVFGLRRGFEVAGAGTLILSLWSVRDDAVRDWMHELYSGRLEGLATADAVNRAGRRWIEERRAAGQTTHPFNWGAFVATGDWD